MCIKKKPETESYNYRLQPIRIDINTFYPFQKLQRVGGKKGVSPCWKSFQRRKMSARRNKVGNPLLSFSYKTIDLKRRKTRFVKLIYFVIIANFSIINILSLILLTSAITYVYLVFPPLYKKSVSAVVKRCE